jgi:DNA primase
MQQLLTIYENLGIIKDSTKTKLTIPCILHNEKNGKSLYLNFEKGFYRCFGKCQQSGSLMTLLSSLGFTDIVLSNESMIRTLLEKNNDKPKEINPLPFKLVEKSYNNNINEIPYLSNRGISADIYQKNYIWLNRDDMRVYIPIFFNKKYYGNISRTIYNIEKIWQKIEEEMGIKINIDDRNEIEFEILYDKNSKFRKYNKSAWKYKYFSRYLNDPSLPKDRILYEPLYMGVQASSDSPQKWLITEGCFDTLRACMGGYNSLAILGGGINAMQCRYIMQRCNNNYLVLGFDNDKAGSQFYHTFIKNVKQFVKRLDFNMVNRKVKDISDISINELNYLYDNAVIM